MFTAVYLPHYYKKVHYFLYNLPPIYFTFSNVYHADISPFHFAGQCIRFSIVYAYLLAKEISETSITMVDQVLKLWANAEGTDITSDIGIGHVWGDNGRGIFSNFLFKRVRYRHLFNSLPSANCEDLARKFFSPIGRVFCTILWCFALKYLLYLITWQWNFLSLVVTEDQRTTLTLQR